MGTSLNGLTPAGTYPGLIKTGDNAPIDGTLKTLSDGNGNNLPMSVSTSTINLTGTAQVGGVAIANTTQVNAKQDTLVSGTNIKTINSTSLLGSGNIDVVTSPSGSAGYIQFSNGSAFASDANLFWDNTNKRLGIGTTSPSTTLHVNGQTTFADNALFSADFKYIGRDINGSSIRFASASNEIRANISTGGQFHVYNAGSGSSRFAVSSGGQTTISGGGSTSATTSLLVQNSSGYPLMTIPDGGARITFGLDLEAGTLFGQVYIPGKLFLGSSGSAVFGNDSLDASAVLQANSTTKGFLPPRMTDAQVRAIASPAVGLMAFNTDLDCPVFYSAAGWRKISHSVM